jgi:hypothetical protein
MQRIFIHFLKAILQGNINSTNIDVECMNALYCRDLGMTRLIQFSARLVLSSQKIDPSQDTIDRFHTGSRGKWPAMTTRSSQESKSSLLQAEPSISLQSNNTGCGHCLGLAKLHRCLYVLERRSSRIMPKPGSTITG